MSANVDFQKVNEWDRLRGFSNLFRKENRAWWGTNHRWMIAILWTVFLGGLTAIMLFVPSEEVKQATQAEIAQAGGTLAFILNLGLSVFFEFGVPILAIGTVILTQDLILGEKQSGVAEWLLSKPVTRCSFILAKLAATTLWVIPLLVFLPSILIYAMLSIRMGLLYPLMPFLSAIGIMTMHTLFYITITVMLATIFNNRGPVLGITISSTLFGGILGGYINPLLYVTPWMLPKIALLFATSQVIPTEIGGVAPLIATTIWIVVFIFVTLIKFEKMDW